MTTLLVPELERHLVARWRTGDRDAGRRIVEAFAPLVFAIALSYRRRGEPIDDLVQEGNIGLLKAATRYDPERGCRLSTYASYFIRAEMRERLMRSMRIVRLGSSKSERRAVRLYQRTRERDPEVVAATCGLSIEKATALLRTLVGCDVSLDTAPSGGVAVAEQCAADAPSPEDLAADADERALAHARLERALAELPARERLIVRARWLTETPRTLEDLGGELGITRERVRQLEERAKQRLRTSLEASREEK